MRNQGKNYGCIKAFTGGSHCDGFGPVCGVFCLDGFRTLELSPSSPDGLSLKGINRFIKCHKKLFILNFYFKCPK